MASRRPIYTFQLTGCATESNENTFYYFIILLCCFMRATHAINNIYKLISFLNLYNISTNGLLFLLFINEIGVLSNERCVCKLYADDVKLYTTLQTNEDCTVLQQQLCPIYMVRHMAIINIS